VIICICRGKSDTDIAKAIERGASSVRDLQRCGIGDQCGSCHTTLKGMLARAAAAPAAAADGCPGCNTTVGTPAALSAMA
jgi:bacterioferritin-associated ferredoxin